MRAAPALVLAALAAGALVRVLGGSPLLLADLATEARPGPRPPEGTPESAVYAFYESLAKGDFAKAWELSLEPVWASAPTASYADEVPASPALVGWTGKEDFVRRCGEDLSSGFRLKSIEAKAEPGRPKAQAQALAAALRAAPLHEVKASGQLLGACLIYHWDKDLVVAEIGGAYKVVLPGTKAAKSLFHQAWFADLALVGSLRSGAP